MIKNKTLRVVAAVALAHRRDGGRGDPRAAVPSRARVHLHLGSDGRYFKFGTTTQTLTTANNSCGINSTAARDEPLVARGRRRRRASAPTRSA